ncbi:MAG: 4Fe-4S binding protein [Proteobacteria bacterium]|nr:4Fe-4S binding protein [Pseudomonadota bacterium]
MLYRITSIIRKFVLIFTIFLIYNGLNIYAKDQNEILYMYANMTNFSFWLIFLMGSILLSPIGRVFCAICPVGEVNFLTSRWGLKKRIYFNLSFLQGIAMLLLFLLVITLHISRHPHYTSLLISTVLMTALILGLLFRGNIFCLHLCPANGFLKFYSKFSFLKIICNGDVKVGSPCMVFLNPCNHQRENCHICLRCFENSEGLKVSFKKPETNFTPLSINDFFIFSILFGLTIMAFIRVVRNIREIFVYPPYIFSQILNIDEKYIIYLVVFFGVIIYPIIFILLVSFLKKVFIKDSLKNIISETITYLILPLFSVHLILALIKLNARLGFLPYVINDPSGKDTIMLYQMKKIGIPYDLIPIDIMKYIILFLPLITLFCAYFIFFKGKNYSIRDFINMILIIIFFIFIEICILMWLFKGIT